MWERMIRGGEMRFELRPEQPEDLGVQSSGNRELQAEGTACTKAWGWPQAGRALGTEKMPVWLEQSEGGESRRQ